MLVSDRERIEVKQSTAHWHALRSGRIGSSLAPAVMGVCEYVSYSRAIDEFLSPSERDDNNYIYVKGHKAEAAARNLVAQQYSEYLQPSVYACSVGDVPLIASLDGEGSRVWEHKIYSRKRADIFPDPGSSIWQIEHLMLVSGLDECIYTISDLSRDKMPQSAIIRSDESRRESYIVALNVFWQELKRRIKNGS